jgi:hypothetical protein
MTATLATALPDCRAERIVAQSVFGPYVTGSARTEQIVILALAGWVLVTGLLRLVNVPAAPSRSW